MANIVFKKEATTGDLINRTIQRVYRDKRRGHPPAASKPPKRERDRTKELARNRKIRRSLIASGLCPNCKGERSGEYIACDECRARWRAYNERHRLKKAIQKAYKGA